MGSQLLLSARGMGGRLLGQEVLSMEGSSAAAAASEGKAYMLRDEHKLERRQAQDQHRHWITELAAPESAVQEFGDS